MNQSGDTTTFCQSQALGFPRCGADGDRAHPRNDWRRCCRCVRHRASDPLVAAHNRLSDATGIEVSTDNAGVVRHGQVIVVAVKPQVVEDLLTEVRSEIRPEHLVISIAAGVSLATLPPGTRPRMPSRTSNAERSGAYWVPPAGYCVERKRNPRRRKAD